MIDHGNDPCSNSTDHSREFVPLLVYSESIRQTDLRIWGLGKPLRTLLFLLLIFLRSSLRFRERVF
ncbi:MAG: hypothetical protein ABJG33_20075 [Balneola sp.]